MTTSVNFTLNSKHFTILLDPFKRLIDVLREDLNLTGTKEGCGEGECGACSVIINGELINSCIYPAMRLEGKEVLTIEGLKSIPEYNVLKESFEEAGAVQCGFCTPGMIMAAYCLLKKCPNPTEEQIREGISGNLCRCTGYGSIVNAIKIAATRGDALW